MKALVTDYAWSDLEIERRILAPLGVELVVAEKGTEYELARLAVDVDGIFTNWKHVTRKVIENGPKCQVIIRYGVGLDNIDVSYATEIGILVANVPDYCIEEVSDHALALLLALGLKAGTPLYRLRGKTLGIVGFGQIGRMLAQKARGFGFHILASNRRNLSPSKDEEGVETVSFDELLRRSDFISIHVPLVAETRHIFNVSAFRKMKKMAYIINTARGDVIDSDALLEALDEGWIAGAALDVLPKEPPAPHDRLLAHPKTIVTPHAAFNSEESLEDLRRTASSEMLDVFSGRVPKFLVNRAVLDHQNLRASLKKVLNER
jgi:D-3-phosphoglycerate dehydrogenase / 2-oxoglutarate reductase